MRLLILALLSSLIGCTSWRTASVSPKELIDRPNPPGQIEVTVGDPPVVLRHPSVSGDSLHGYLRIDSLRSVDNPQGVTPAAFALADVRTVRTRKTNAFRTLALVTTLGFTVYVGASMGQWDGGVSFPCGLLGESCLP